MSTDYSRGFHPKWGEIIGLCDPGLSEITARARAASFCSASLCWPALQSNLTLDMTGSQLKEKAIFSCDIKLQTVFIVVNLCFTFFSNALFMDEKLFFNFSSHMDVLHNSVKVLHPSFHFFIFCFEDGRLSFKLVVSSSSPGFLMVFQIFFLRLFSIQSLCFFYVQLLFTEASSEMVSMEGWLSRIHS